MGNLLDQLIRNGEKAEEDVKNLQAERAEMQKTLDKLNQQLSDLKQENGGEN